MVRKAQDRRMVTLVSGSKEGARPPGQVHTPALGPDSTQEPEVLPDDPQHRRFHG